MRLSNIKGLAPPPTTKLAIFYHGGYEAQLLTNATGYGTAEKWKLFEAQMHHVLEQKGLKDKFQLLDFQILGTPASNPRSQFASTTYCRSFVQADSEAAIYGLLKAWSEIAMHHFSGFHLSLDTRTALPRSYLAFYPALYPQHKLNEGVVLLDEEGGMRRPWMPDIRQRIKAWESERTMRQRGLPISPHSVPLERPD